MNIKKLYPELILEADPSKFFKKIRASIETNKAILDEELMAGMVQVFTDRYRQKEVFKTFGGYIGGSFNRDFILKLGLSEDMIYEEVQFLKDFFEVFLKDQITLEAGMNIACFNENQNRKYYEISKEFFKEFKNVSLKGLKFSDLPKLTAYVHLPYPITDGESDYHHLFVSHGRVEELYHLDSYGGTIDEKRYPTTGDVFAGALFGGNEAGAKNAVRVFRSMVPLDTSTELESWFSESKLVFNTLSDLGKFTEVKESYNTFMHQVCNVVAYIGSGNPDIRVYKNEIEYRKRSVPINRHRDLSTKEINLVGYSWKKPIVAHINEWTRSGHFRWQRYGVGLSLIKLKWIDEHLVRRDEHNLVPQSMPSMGGDVV